MATNSHNNGQVMLMTVLVLSAMVLSVTVIAGLITVYSIRNAGSALHSVRAIYAAEAGLELELYRWYKDQTYCHGPSPLPGPPLGTPSNTPWIPTPYPASANCYSAPTLSNGVTYTTEIRYEEASVGGPPPGGTVITTIDRIRSSGQSHNTARALQANF